MCDCCRIMYTAVVLTLVCVVTAWPQDNYKRYEGYKVLEIRPTSQQQVLTLRKLMIENAELDFWQEPSRLLDPVHVMAGPIQMARLTTFLRKQDMTWTVYKDHIERDIDDFAAKERTRRSISKYAFNISDFNTYEDILTWLEDLLPVCAVNNFVCEYRSAGQSFEGRDIPIFSVSSDGDTSKPMFFMDATIHAREWLAPATILKIINHVVMNDPAVTLLDNANFVFMPVYNPDGYVYSWDMQRLWRKNRSPQEGGCFGVDLNRNCDYMWGEEGVSTIPCSDLYCGSAGNSELETQVFDAEIKKYVPQINQGGAYITFHSYGYMWMHPWGNTVDHAGRTCERADDHDEMFRVADATADAIEDVYNTRWARGTSCEVIYETTGATDDYTKGVYGLTFPFCPELRGNSFIIDASQIQPSFEEVWAGIVAKYGALNGN